MCSHGPSFSKSKLHIFLVSRNTRGHALSIAQWLSSFGVGDIALSFQGSYICNPGTSTIFVYPISTYALSLFSAIVALRTIYCHIDFISHLLSFDPPIVQSFLQRTIHTSRPLEQLRTSYLIPLYPSRNLQVYGSMRYETTLNVHKSMLMPRYSLTHMKSVLHACSFNIYTLTYAYVCIYMHISILYIYL